MSSKRERYLIEVKGGDQAPAELPRSGMLVIGSSADKAGFCIQGQGVADVHCAIGKTKDGGFAIKDLGSEFGTLVNGNKITQARLNAGDDILVGSMRLCVVAAGARPVTSEVEAPPQEKAQEKARKKTKKKPKQASAPKEARPAKSPLPRIPGYEVHKRLGRGAMGDVYLSVQQSLDREVAIKVLSAAHEQDAAFVESFQAEARSAAALNHPNVVTVHDVGEAEGVHYLTMEYMDRGSLEERVAREGPLPWPLVLDALKDAASGLVYAESRGIVHRDIKPANLMQNHTGVTKIADLGLATSISQEEAPDGERKLFGTPHFISPEQVKGEKADCRSDLYSLGSTAYRLLTGRTPFEGANTREILRAKLRGEPTPIRELTSDVPENLQVIVARSMALEPSDRYPSASALLREIEALQAGTTTGAAGAPGATGSPKLLKIAIPVAIVAVLAIGGAMLSGGDSGGGSSAAKGTEKVDKPEEDTELFTDVSTDPDAHLPLAEVTDDPPDNDIQEKLFETAAENALLKLGQRDLLKADRRDALRELAKEYMGTTAATTAIEEANRIDTELALAKKQAEARDTRLGGMLKTLREAANLEDTELRPGNSLRAMRAVEGQVDLAGDDAFLIERSKLEAEVISTALAQFDVIRATIETQTKNGEFEALKTTATDLIGRCDLPTFDDGMAPARADEVDALATEMRELVANLDILRVEYARNLNETDRQSVAQSVGGNAGLAGEIARLDFDAAASRCEALANSLRSAEAKAWSANLSAELASAAKAIPLLVDNFSDWRRLKFSDPEDSRGKMVDAKSISSSGIVLDDKGSSRTIAWTSFGGNTKALDTLFSKRLDRNYTEEEQASIGALMHFSALTECLNQAGEMFRRSGNAVFTVGEAEELPAAFDIAEEWLDDADKKSALQLDRRAAQLLASALRSASDGQWTTAVSQLEELLNDYPNSLLVRLLSDGSPR